ncbi:hypothetical protein C8R44DRAFT_829597 [Mycena epipterygia]|nr:hypothetical protein C8R44DRAFT_829597 [Mycena epipterygia]
MDPDGRTRQWVVPYTPHGNSGSFPANLDSMTLYGPAGEFFPNTAPTTPAADSIYGSSGTGRFRFLDAETPQSGVAPHTSTKRRRQNSHVNLFAANDKNIQPTPSNPSKKRAKTTDVGSSRQSRRTDDEKMKSVLNAIKGQGWTLAEFLYRLFRKPDEDDAPPSNQHAQMVSKFLGGTAEYTPSDILTCWMTNPYGAIPVNSPQAADMYSTTTPYTAICPVRPAFTSFAVQTGAERAVQASSGLHTSVSIKSKDTVKQLKWTRLGSDTISTVGDIVELHLEAAWYLLDLISTRKPRTRDGVQLPPRKSRPSRGVIIHALADLLFCRSNRANLLPVARGILYFGSSVPVEIMAYNCRIGTMPVGLSTEEALVAFNHGRDPTKAGILLFDNVQNLARNHMNVGMSGLWVEAWDGIDVAVFDLHDKRQRINNMDKLISFLDQEDADTTGYLEWLELHHQQVEVTACYRATEKLVIPLDKSVVHTLAASGKKETIPAELKDGLLDFLAQVGQLPTDYILRKLIVGGDGLSYAMVWHTKWTDLIRIFQTHWGRVSGKSTNPASLGHSAAKIGQAAPSNMKKVEFYPGSQLIYLVLDARILDCWSYLAEEKRLPAFDDLVATAKKLHQTYSTARARDHAIYDTGSTSEWAKTIPTGSKWTPIDVEDSSLDQTKKKKSKGKKKAKPIPPPCKGDFVLGQAVDFFRDAINSRKIAFAVAEGNVGRLYECIKYMLFTFAGSTHTNYMGYILETIINLELESSPGLKEALLLCLLINLTGLAGHFEEGDYVVEFFNRLLEDVVQHRNAQRVNDNFIRNVVSRNLRHIAELKPAWRTGTGMAPKSKKHTDPHTNPEMLILLKTYREEELHSRRLGRQVDDRDTDDLQKVSRSSTTRAAETTPVPVVEVDSENDSEANSEDENNGDTSSDESEESDMEEQGLYATRGSMAVVDGQLVMDDRDMMLGPDGEEMLGPEGWDNTAADDMSSDEEEI